MAAINDLIEQIENPELRFRLQQEVNKLNKQRKFGLVFEDHVPENTFLYDVPVKRGSLVAKRDNSAKETFRVIRIDGEDALCEHTVSHEQETISVDDLVSVAQLGEPIYPYLKPMGVIKNAPDSELWHTLIEADNYHALQLLVYLYGGQVDCIYIDPPYNTGARDWKYNNDYVDGNDTYRHSKWLSMMEKRLLLAKKLLNPQESVLIVTIDEKEYHHLACLLEQLFPEANIQMVSSVINPKGSVKAGLLTRCDEYIFFIYIGKGSANACNDDFLFASTQKKKVRWPSLKRTGSNSRRGIYKSNAFYPIFYRKDTGKFDHIGDSLPHGVPRSTVTVPDDLVAVWPLDGKGEERIWQLYPESFKELAKQGFIKFGRLNKGSASPYYVSTGLRNKILSGEIVINGKDTEGSVLLEYASGQKEESPKTVWNKTSHSASEHGTNLLTRILGDNRFSYPKSLYAVRDTINIIAKNKPDAIILDFFAGSGTTLHAVNLLNKEDGGHRRCIMVTNNEIGEAKENELRRQGICPGDEDWEKWGVARYVNWPRTECSIQGIDMNGNPINGDYITTTTEVKLCDRRFNQINFLTDIPSLKQKKTLVSLINKQKTIKLPTMSEDTDYLLAEDDDFCNASILFNVAALDDWKDALEGHDEITDFYIVTQKDALFRKIKAEVSELMGQIEESVPVTMPMKDGFKANAAYFKLGFLDKTSIALGRQFKELLPILWMKAGAKGECPKIDSDGLPQMLICEKNHFAVLIDENAYPSFEKKMNETEDIDVVYIVTDSDSGYKEMAQGLHVGTTYQLYRDYLDNFRINNVR